MSTIAMMGDRSQDKGMQHDGGLFISSPIHTAHAHFSYDRCPNQTSQDHVKDALVEPVPPPSSPSIIMDDGTDFQAFFFFFWAGNLKNGVMSWLDDDNDLVRQPGRRP